MTQNAAVSAKLSTRARTLSQRRKNRPQEGLDLSHQDQPMGSSESGMWVPASAHRAEEDEEEYDDDEEAPSTVNGEARGREEERVAA